MRPLNMMQAKQSLILREGPETENIDAESEFGVKNKELHFQSFKQSQLLFATCTTHHV